MAPTSDNPRPPKPQSSTLRLARKFLPPFLSLYHISPESNNDLPQQLRLFSAILHRIVLFPRPRFTPLTGPRALFRPLITTSTTPLLECDYNMHKSNSTYFSDLDISRTHLVSCLCTPIFRNGLKDDPKGTKGKIAVMLGAVGCTFRKEIRPGQGFEIWSRFLAWDRKWMYIVSHFVRKGEVRPDGFTLQGNEEGGEGWFGPRRKGTRKEEQNGQANEPTRTATNTSPDPPHPAIFATAISKYVFKIGRRTIPPETILSSSDLLPQRPTSDESSTTHSHHSSQPPTSEPSTPSSPPTEPHSDPDPQKWDWAHVETIRLQGLEIAHSLAGLDSAHKTFRAGSGPALGYFRDLIW